MSSIDLLSIFKTNKENTIAGTLRSQNNERIVGLWHESNSIFLFVYSYKKMNSKHLFNSIAEFQWELY